MQRSMSGLPFARADLDEVLIPLREAKLLPAAAYLEPSVLELERREIFGRSWLPDGRSDDLDAPGAWLCAPIGREGVIVVRGPDLRLRAFFNVCRHRGALLVRETVGIGASFECPYHGFTYDLLGALKKSPLTDELV